MHGPNIATALLLLASTALLGSCAHQPQLAVGAVEADPSRVLASPRLPELSPAQQLAAHRFAASAAADAGDVQRAHTIMVDATALQQASVLDWLLRAEWASFSDDSADAAIALTTVVTRWPEEISDPDLSEFVAQIAYHAGRDRDHRTTYLALVEALYAANFVLIYDTQPDDLWEDLVLEALQKGDLRRALEVAERIESVAALLRMQVDRRFDAVVDADPERFDLRAAADRGSMVSQRAMADRPRELYAFVQHAYALFDQGRYREVLAHCDSILAAIERAPVDAPPYDDLDRSLNWVHNHKAVALRAMGRWDDALQVMERALRLDERGAENVSQTINLGNYYNDAGQPQRALAAVRALDCTGRVSPYGCMQLHEVRHRAYRQLGKSAEAEAALDYLRTHRREAEQTWRSALLDAGDLDAAAALLISQLQDPAERGAALASVQDYRTLPMTPVLQQAHDRWLSLLARPEVAAAINAVGRRREVPIYLTPD